MAKIVYKRNKQGNRYAGSQTILGKKDIPTAQSHTKTDTRIKIKDRETIHKSYEIFKNIISLGEYKHQKSLGRPSGTWHLR